MPQEVDVVVVGGGYGGMSCSLILGRCMIRTVTINEERPRNAAAQAAHGYLTRDGIQPMEMLRLAKEELTKYQEYVTYVKGVVTEIVKLDEGRYEVRTNGQGTFKAKRLVLAMGLNDDLSKVGLKGLEDIWGKTAFHCPFCDGYEFRGQKMALFGDEEGIDHFARGVKNWARDLVLFVKPGIVKNEDKVVMAKNKIRVVEDPVDELLSKDGQLTAVKLINGEVIPRQVAFVFSSGETMSDIPAKLGVKKSDWGSYNASTEGKTDVKGLYIIGDLKDFLTGAITAASQGSVVAEAIAHEIFDERWIK